MEFGLVIFVLNINFLLVLEILRIIVFIFIVDVCMLILFNFVGKIE